MRRLRGAREQALLALNEGTDLVNTHFALYACTWLNHLERVPLVVSFHGPWAREMLAEARGGWTVMKATAAKYVERAVYRRAQRCITLSQSFATLLNRDYGVPSSRIAVIPGGAELEAFSAAPARLDARIRLGWPLERPIVLAVRRLTRRMGLELLVQAAEQLRRDCPDVLILIAGKGPVYDELAHAIETRGLGDTVRLLGFVPEEQLPIAYAAADVTVVPSVSLEGFGLVIVESLAAGTPVVCTPVGGMPEVIAPLDPALLADAASPEAIAERLRAVLTGRQAVPGPLQCREYAQRFDWKVVFPRILEVWREVGANV